MLMLILTIVGTITGVILFIVEWPKITKWFIRLLIKLNLKKRQTELFALGVYWTYESPMADTVIYHGYKLIENKVPIPRCPKSKGLLIWAYKDEKTKEIKSNYDLPYMLCADCEEGHHYFIHRGKKITLANAIKITKRRFR